MISNIKEIQAQNLLNLVKYHQKNCHSLDCGVVLMLVKPINKTFKGILKYADYSADSFSTDTKKIWLALEANFNQ